MKTCTNLNCPERKSTCCGAISEASIADEGTGCFVCSNCKKEYIGGECTAGLKEKILNLIAEEILICHKENTPTSRLTSLAMKLKKI